MRWASRRRMTRRLRRKRRRSSPPRPNLRIAGRAFRIWLEGCQEIKGSYTSPSPPPPLPAGGRCRIPPPPAPRPLVLRPVAAPVARLFPGYSPTPERPSLVAKYPGRVSVGLGVAAAGEAEAAARASAVKPLPPGVGGWIFGCRAMEGPPASDSEMDGVSGVVEEVRDVEAPERNGGRKGGRSRAAISGACSSASSSPTGEGTEGGECCSNGGDKGESGDVPSTSW